jgi:hypothetical protein
MRSTARSFGTIFNFCALIGPGMTLPLSMNVVIIVWHLRLGDFVLHQPNDVFFENVVKFLITLLEGFYVRILILGGGGKVSTIPSDYMNRITSLVSKYWFNMTVPQIETPQLTFTEALCAMMEADILIGNGSSLPLFSERPLFLNHIPKHNFNFGAEYLSDSVLMDSTGYIYANLWRLKGELRRRMSKPVAPCRK